MQTREKNAKPHLVYVLPYAERGGTEAHVGQLLAGLGDRYRLSLLAPWGEGLGALTAIPGVRHHAFPRWDRQPVQGVRALWQRVRSIHHQEPIDLIHVHAAAELLVLLRGALPKVPLVLTVHGYHTVDRQFSYWLAAQLARWTGAQVVTVCAAEYNHLAACGLPGSHLQLIANGVAELTPEPSAVAAWQEQCGFWGPSEFVLGTAARLVPIKGLRFLLMACAQLHREFPQLRLVVAGSGAQKDELQALSENLGIADRVQFVGHTDRLAALMTWFDVFALPSLQEAASLACLEAMALGKAVIATEVGGTAEQVLVGATGLLVPPGDVPALVTQLRFCLENPDLVRQMGANGRQRYREFFTLESMLARTADLYRSVLNP
ncbi:MAG: glycosyltransferase family 4 protein [Oscillatoriales cyanobacterium SM2_1_8]|nr:glycosyltransferase family 4 protein [Oscillatoriales cyanobacterium SM2_1_8]